ncbi:MAG: hypothetical protein AAGJ54_12405 [Planctomycetota bacterium]
MKMQVRWFVTGAIASAAVGALLGAATFQPGLEPPAGPVSDTSPSLAEIDAKLDSLIGGVAAGDPANLVSTGRLNIPNGTGSVFIGGSNATARLVSIIVPNGDIEVQDANGTVVDILRANSVNAGSGFTGFAQYNLNIDIDLPLTIVRRSAQFIPEVTVLYRELD